jgi:hypothetical protein
MLIIIIVHFCAKALSHARKHHQSELQKTSFLLHHSTVRKTPDDDMSASRARKKVKRVGVANEINEK